MTHPTVHAARGRDQEMGAVIEAKTADLGLVREQAFLEKVGTARPLEHLDRWPCECARVDASGVCYVSLDRVEDSWPS